MTNSVTCTFVDDFDNFCYMKVIYCFTKLSPSSTVLSRRKSLSGNWKTNVGQSILEEVKIFEQIPLHLIMAGDFEGLFHIVVCKRAIF